MPFSHGKNAILWMNGVKLSAFLREISGGPVVDIHDKSVFEQNDKTYLAGTEGSTLSMDGLFDGVVSAIDDLLKNLLASPSGEIFTWLPAGDGFVSRFKGMLATQTAYDVATAATEIATVHLESTSNVGHESGQTLHPMGAETATGNDTSTDHGAATTLGGAGYLQVSAASGSASPTLDVVIQHSVDNAVWVDLITFAQVALASVPTALRAAVTTNPVNRWTRSKRTIAGTTPSFTYHVGFNRKFF